MHALYLMGVLDPITDVAIQDYLQADLGVEDVDITLHPHCCAAELVFSNANDVEKMKSIKHFWVRKRLLVVVEEDPVSQQTLPHLLTVRNGLGGLTPRTPRSPEPKTPSPPLSALRSPSIDIDKKQSIHKFCLTGGVVRNPEQSCTQPYTATHSHTQTIKPPIFAHTGSKRGC